MYAHIKAYKIATEILEPENKSLIAEQAATVLCILMVKAD